LEIQLNYNDILTLYSDGITESKNDKLEDFGMEKFEQILVDNRNLPVEEIADRIIESVDDFSKDYIQHDDITLVLFKWGN